MSEQLRECPHCGATRGLYTLDEHGGLCADDDLIAQIFCDNCKSAFENERANNGEELIEAWNTRSESVRRIKDSDLPKTSPLSGIPRIRVYDKDGRKCAEGYYAFHKNRQLCVIGDELKPEDCDHCIITDGFADWNMPRSIKVGKIVPEGGWIEVVS